MSTFNSGAGSRLAVGLQPNYFRNKSQADPAIADTTITNLLNITGATFDPSVEKVSEETLLKQKIKSGSLLTSITMDGSFDANLRPDMTDWLFTATCQLDEIPASTSTSTTGYGQKVFELQEAGEDPVGSTFVLEEGNISKTYPSMVVRSMTMEMPNNDFVTVSVDLTGREEIIGTTASQVDTSAYEYKTIPNGLDFQKKSYIVTEGVFEWNGIEWCIESSTLTIDNGIEESPRCYQDGKYTNIPVMGMRSVTFDFNIPYTDKVEDLKKNYLLTSEYGHANVTFTSPDSPNEKVVVDIPNLSITSVSAGISGTGVIEASVSGEAVQVGSTEAITITVQSTLFNA